MELAIPLIALGGMYIISNQNTSTNSAPKEKFTNMSTLSSLPNTNVPPQNYPIMNNKELVDTVQEYPNPNKATDKYFNQNVYQQKQKAGIKVNSNIQEIYSLTGDYLNSEEFRHNNMVPFNGGKPKGQIYNNNNSETILDNYVGNGSQTIKKIEQAPLFKPQDSVQWTHGMPSTSDFFQSRQNPASKNNIVKPFESIRVGPGLDKGFCADGSSGFNSGMESRDKWLPKTVDELRITTNPKEEFSLLNHQGPAQSRITNIGIEGKVEKYRPDTFFINSQDRWLTTTGAEKASRVVSEEVQKTSHRNDTTTQLMGTPNAVLKTASYVPKRYEEPKRNQLSALDVGHSSARGTAPHHKDKDIYQKSHTNYSNSRATNSQPQTFGSGFSSAVGAAIAPIMDILRPSRKEEYTCNMRVYGNMGGEVAGNYILDTSDVPNTTTKETTLYQPHGYIGYQSNDAHTITEHQPVKNQRDTTTENCGNNGFGGGGSKYGNKQYDYVYRQTNNQTKEKTVVARTNQGNTNQFNPYMNVTMSKLDADRNNNRLWAPEAVIPNGPSVQTYGKSSMPQYNNECNGCERISPDLLNAFKSNPYTQSLMSAV